MWTSSHRSRGEPISHRTAANPTRFTDFRKLLERDDIHAIINGTPDHWHSLINIGAAKAGKDIYSEKPLTLTIDEGKHVVRAVRDNKVVLQTGTQQRSSERFRMACELVRNGRIGKLKEVTVWLPAGVRGGPFKPKPVPAHLDWDFWQGQAPPTNTCRSAATPPSAIGMTTPAAP
jgi:predicted dehydrogenase